MSIIQESICWDGCYAEILLYGLFSGSYKENSISYIMGEVKPLRIAKPFNLVDEIGIINGNRLDLFSVKLQNYPKAISKYLEFLFNQLYEAGALASWVMFDGAFHFEHLLTEDVAKQIYGFQINGNEPKLALEDNKIDSIFWVTEIQSLRCELIDKNLIELI